MKKYIIFQLIVLTAFLYAGASEKEVDGARWSEYKIRVIGESHIRVNSDGRPIDELSGEPISLNEARIQARKRSRLIAVEKISRLLGKLTIENGKTINTVLDEDMQTKNKIAMMLKNEVSYRESPAGFSSSHCIAELSMGSILQSLPLTYPEESFPVPSAIPIATAYTSLIIDARGLEVSPMLSPAVYAGDGLEIYNRYFVDPAFAVRTGIAAYVHTEKEALKHPKAGSHPLFTAAIGNVKSNPIISTRDIRRILSSPGNIMELKKCRVIFIVDRVD